MFEGRESKRVRVEALSTGRIDVLKTVNKGIFESDFRYTTIGLKDEPLPKELEKAMAHADFYPDDRFHNGFLTRLLNLENKRQIWPLRS